MNHAYKLLLHKNQWTHYYDNLILDNWKIASVEISQAEDAWKLLSKADVYSNSDCFLCFNCPHKTSVT